MHHPDTVNGYIHPPHYGWKDKQLWALFIRPPIFNYLGHFLSEHVVGTDMWQNWKQMWQWAGTISKNVCMSTSSVAIYSRGVSRRLLHAMCQKNEWEVILTDHTWEVTLDWIWCTPNQIAFVTQKSINVVHTCRYACTDDTNSHKALVYYDTWAPGCKGCLLRRGHSVLLRRGHSVLLQRKHLLGHLLRSWCLSRPLANLENIWSIWVSVMIICGVRRTSPTLWYMYLLHRLVRPSTWHTYYNKIIVS